MATGKMLLKKDGAIGRLIFNNPDKHNAVSLEMWGAAARMLDEFQQDDTVRVVVVSGTGGKAFVSGADISQFADQRSSSATIAHYENKVRQLYDRLSRLPQPTIAMIDGYCLGGGLGLAVCCDLRFCSEGSRFGLPAARLGLSYPYEALRRLLDTLGPGETRDIAFSARRFDAAEAHAMHLVQHVLPAEELEPFVMNYVHALAANAPLTVRALKRIIGEILKDPAERDLDLCEQLVETCFTSTDYVEGRRAFLEKREPVFHGR